MLTLALGATLIGFALLVIALITGNFWLAVACIAICLVGLVLLLIDAVRSSKRAGAGPDDEPLFTIKNSGSRSAPLLDDDTDTRGADSSLGLDDALSTSPRGDDSFANVVGPPQDDYRRDYSDYAASASAPAAPAPEPEAPSPAPTPPPGPITAPAPSTGDASDYIRSVTGQVPRVSTTGQVPRVGATGPLPPVTPAPATESPLARSPRPQTPQTQTQTPTPWPPAEAPVPRPDQPSAPTPAEPPAPPAPESADGGPIPASSPYVGRRRAAERTSRRQAPAPAAEPSRDYLPPQAPAPQPPAPQPPAPQPPQAAAPQAPPLDIDKNDPLGLGRPSTPEPPAAQQPTAPSEPSTRSASPVIKAPASSESVVIHDRTGPLPKIAFNDDDE